MKMCGCCCCNLELFKDNPWRPILLNGKLPANNWWKMSVLENFKFFFGSPSNPQHEEIFVVKYYFIWLVFLVCWGKQLSSLFCQREDYSKHHSKEDHCFPPSPHPNTLLIPGLAGLLNEAPKGFPTTGSGRLSSGKRRSWQCPSAALGWCHSPHWGVPVLWLPPACGAEVKVRVKVRVRAGTVPAVDWVQAVGCWRR